MTKQLIYICQTEGMAQALLAYIELNKLAKGTLVFQHGGKVAKQTLQSCQQAVIIGDGEVDQLIANCHLARFSINDAVNEPQTVLDGMTSLCLYKADKEVVSKQETTIQSPPPAATTPKQEKPAEPKEEEEVSSQPLPRKKSTKRWLWWLLLISIVAAAVVFGVMNMSTFMT